MLKVGFGGGVFGALGCEGGDAVVGDVEFFEGGEVFEAFEGGDAVGLD